MRIVEIVERTVSIASSIANAYIDFSKMTCSVVAVVTDVVRDGQPVVGYGFNSNGRYGQGALMRERFLPRLLEAAPRRCSIAAHDNLDPHTIWADADDQRKARRAWRALGRGRHASTWRSGMRWRRSRDSRSFACWPSATGTAPADARVCVYAAGGYYDRARTIDGLQEEMRGYRARGYTVVKMKIGGAPLAEDLRRIEAVLEVVGQAGDLAVDANGRFDLPTAIAYAQALEPYNLFWYEEAGDPLDYALQAELAQHYEPPMATGENLFSHARTRAI